MITKLEMAKDKRSKAGKLAGVLHPDVEALVASLMSNWGKRSITIPVIFSVGFFRVKCVGKVEGDISIMTASLKGQGGPAELTVHWLTESHRRGTPFTAAITFWELELGTEPTKPDHIVRAFGFIEAGIRIGQRLAAVKDLLGE